MSIIKRYISPAAFQLARLTHRFADWLPEETVLEQREAHTFVGDLSPVTAPEPGPVFHQRRVVFARPRPFVSRVSDLRYTPRGMAWVNGRLERRYSFEEIGLRQLLDFPRRPVREYAQATVLQAQTPFTYGDWVSEHVAMLALALREKLFVAPLLLPARWAAKPYVRRDLAAMGIAVEPADGTLLIRNAQVLHKRRPNHYWTEAEAGAILEAMSIVPAPAAPGSALYLSRLGERGEGPQRELNNAAVEAAMQAAGVRIVRTAGRTLDDYIALAPHAETVFADHGSALYNVMRWSTRRVVELYSPAYWDSSFLFLMNSLGITDYHTWRIDADIDVGALAERIRTLMRQPVAAPLGAAPRAAAAAAQ
jgi:Glycosyltransferase 61